MKGPLNYLNEGILADFSTILEHFPVEKSGYIYDCIKKFVNDDLTAKQGYSNINHRQRLKIGELAAKYFSFSHDQA